MILIADSGSTKTDWCLLREGTPAVFFETEGYNPYFVSPAYVVSSLSAALPSTVVAGKIQRVYFYGAGCFEDKAHLIASAMGSVFPNASTEVQLDLLASARALLGNTPGFVGILGTGTNTCLYDGQRITLNIDSLGFLLGDEGSGAYLGKRLLSDFIRGNMPAVVAAEFAARYGVTRELIMETVYSEAMPNRYCASFTPFLLETISGDVYARELVMRGFQDFFEQLVCKYPNYTDYSFNCIGSVADSFQSFLREVAAAYGMAMGRILRGPISGLVEYHSSLADY